MALNKEITTQFGVNASYYKVVGLEINYLEKFARIKFVGYYDESARHSDSKALFSKSYYLDDKDKFDEYFGIAFLSKEGNNAIKSAYSYIKESDEKFTDAVDL